MLLVSTILLLLFIASSLYVGAAIGVLGASLSSLYSTLPLMRGVGEMAWGTSSDFTLVAVPMFILMGEMLLRSGLAEKMFDALDKWVGHIPGGLMHTNIAASTLFAATSGSSVATAATVGTVSIPNMHKHGYRPALFLGSIAAGGTLGILIPPSINMVLYGALSETSVSDLYLAGFIPGLLMALLFSMLVFIACVVNRKLAPRKPRASWGERLRALWALGPPLYLFMLVVGSIYLGWATPTEASALGVVGTFLYVVTTGKFSWERLWTALEGTVRTTAMVMLIVISAYFLNFVMSTIGLTDIAVKAVGSLTWDPLYVMLAIVAVYLLLGCFVETLTLMVATTPIIVPIVVALGYDPVWFGVVFVILIELALITPPIGMNLFVVQSVRTSGAFRDVALGSLPFAAVMLGVIFLLLAVPELATWLPKTYNALK
ncbi:MULTISPECIES: TRAP transporter large permease [unclassified Simplicispira]|uniref:TRAP transporter large permease n=1 Tax=unclassified Simplicispira TaxID=2630407 RepID=UPI000D5C6E1C|nr:MULTISPECIES: TRAP transporter large permease [unclassified Simplicispira]PVY56146.1 tripartite ATP-independent transporter DctM subunit [Simplicispira sp. 125]REG17091.1 tripartite ATP-independent transporter DctM subunit [Simplicispira sp. 110]